MGEKKLILLICHSKQVEAPTAGNSGTEINLVLASDFKLYVCHLKHITLDK